MNKIDFQAINHALDPETVVPHWLPNGYKQGKEWIAANPTRNDRNPGSFSVNLKEGHWKDFATGDAGADLVSLYAYIHHAGDQGAAAHELARNHGVRIGDPVVRQQAAEANNVRKLDDAKPVPVFPVPATADQPTFWHHDHGEPSHKWEYLDKDGRLLMYVCRFDPEGKRKQVLPYTWCKHPNGTQRWTWRGVTRPSKVPLYGWELLTANPDADVIVVEGEKTADAARRLLGATDAVIVSWLGGVDNADRAAVKPLAGRRVIFWPDFDSMRERLSKGEEAAGVAPESKPFLPIHEQPGMRAMMAIAQNCKGVARELVMVGYTVGSDIQSGWDLADAEQEGWSGERVAQYMAANAGDPWHIASAKEPAPPAEPAEPEPTPPAANDNTPKLPLDASVNPFGWPHLTDKGQPLNTAENLAYMLDEYGICARYNIIKKNVEVHIPGRSYGDDLDANCTLAEINSICARNRMPKADAQDYIKLIASQQRYNPVEEFIKSKPWDGKSRLAAMGDTLQTPEGYDRDLMALLLRRWLISAAAAALSPRGFWSKGVLVLQGGQSEGKTSWIKALLPEELRGLMKVGATIDPANKDSVSSVIGHWLVELGELDGTFRKADIARLKSFISQDIDQLRRPYDRLESEYQRRTVFFASVNPKVFLVDDTGNVRWWTIPVTAVNDKHGIDVQQLWAEVATYYEAGERWWLDRDEEKRLEATNVEHQEPNTLEELVLARYDWNDSERTNRMAATEVLIAIGYDKPNNTQAKNMGALLRKLTGGEPVKSSGRSVFKMPPAVGVMRRLPRFEDDGDNSRAY